MDLSSLLAYRPSLLDYLDGGKAGIFDSVAQGLNSKVESTQAKIAEQLAKNGNGDSVTLSEEAKTILSLANGGTEGEAKISGTQKAAQNFLMGFFDQSDLKLQNFSDQTLDFIEGLNGVIAASSATQRDLATDSLETKYQGDRHKVYTLIGGGERLRIALEYGTDGKPAKLSITDIMGGKVETAEITFGKNDDGSPTLEIARTQREYRNGLLVGLEESPLLTMDVYQKVATSPTAP